MDGSDAWGASYPPARPRAGSLHRFTLISLDGAVAGRVVAIRQAQRVKLPDAIIWASALVGGRLLVTRDARAFPANDPGVRVPYKTG